MLSFVFIITLSSCCLCEYYVSTFAGSGRESYADGQDIHASFFNPSGIFPDAFGNVFIADSNNHVIRKINSTGYVSTFAGNRQPAYVDGRSGSASFYGPSDVVVDLFGNIIVSDSANNMIRMINTSGYVSTFAGQDIDAKFNNPIGLAIDLFGNIIVADSGNNLIRRINSTGYVSVVAGSGAHSFSDGQNVHASFYNPSGVAIDSLGNIFVADFSNNRIRKINSTGFVSTLAGNGSKAFADGQGTEAAFYYPTRTTIDSIGNLFVTDSSNHRIRKIDSSGYVTTIAGTGEYGFFNGIGSIAVFFYPEGITIDQNGTIYVADWNNHRIRSIVCFTSNLFSSATESIISTPTGLIINSTETNLFSSAPSSATTLTSPSQSTTKARQMSPILAMYLKPEFTYSALIGMLFVGAMFSFIIKRKHKPKLTGRREKFIQNLEIQRKLELRQKQQSLQRNPNILFSLRTSAVAMLSFLIIFALSSSFLCEYYVGTFAGSGNAKYADGQDILASFYYPSGVAADAFGNLYIADSSNNMIRKINFTGYVSRLAGSGQASHVDGQSGHSSFWVPSDVAVDLLGNIFVADAENHMIRRINASGYVTTLAGSGSASFADGQGMAAKLNYPTALNFDLNGNLIVADSNNHRIRRINSSGYVTTIAGSTTGSFSDGQDVQASFNHPTGVAIDSLGNIFVVDSYNNRIRKINSTSYVSTYAGNQFHTFSDGQGIEATFYNPTKITIDSVDNLYVVDTYNQRIRKIDSSGYVTTIAGSGDSGFFNGPASVSVFNFPQGIVIDANGTIFVADHDNNKIRKIFYSTLNPSSATISATESSIVTPTIAIFTPTDSSISATETNTFPATSSIATDLQTPRNNRISPILAMYLKPGNNKYWIQPKEFTYSALIAMLLVGSIVIFTFIIKRKTKPKLSGRRERFLHNMEMRRRLELKQRQQILAKTRK